jgi:two-component system OmpR family sensor kinase
MPLTDSREPGPISPEATARELITVVAHDLRNYVTPLKGRLDLMRRRALREGHSDYLRDTQDAGRRIERLLRLVDDLLDVSRLERGILNLRPLRLDVAAVACEAAEAFMGEESPIELVATQEVMAYADPERLQQAIENLVANAVRYSPPGAPVRVEVSSYVQNDQPWVLVRVSDEGPGIEPTRLPRLFECFSAGADSTGLGLGLYLVRGIANAHGGTVSVHSVPGKGSTFLLTWPMHPLEELQHAPTHGAHNAA